LDLGKGGHLLTQSAVGEVERKIRFFVEVATKNGSAITCDELLFLLPLDGVRDVDELNSFIQGRLGGLVVSKENFVTTSATSKLIESTIAKRMVSMKKIFAVKEFLSSHPSLFGDVLIAAVSGSTSYGSSDTDDDVDVMLVTKNGKLWTTLFKTLLFLRTRKIVFHSPKNRIEFCFSMVATAQGFKDFLENTKNALVARELLYLKPVKGEGLLMSVLSGCSWIRRYYPRFKPATNEEPAFDVSTKKLGLVESLAFNIVGSYLCFVARLRNAHFRSSGRPADVFEVIKSVDMLIYESNRYKALKRLYSKAFAT
jgi:hypothetical protein